MRLVQTLVCSGQLFLQRFTFTREGLIVDQVSITHLCQVIELTLRVVVCCFEHGAGLGTRFDFRVVTPSQFRECKITELWVNRELEYLFSDLLFQHVFRYGWFVALNITIPSSRATVVGVVADLARRFVVLGLFFCCHIATARPATDDTRERELVDLRLGFAFVTHQDLHTVELIQRDHRFVRSLVFLSVVADDSGIELIVEHLVDHAVRKRLIAGAIAFGGEKAPFIICDLYDLGWIVVSRQHQVPHLPYQMKTVWVFDDGLGQNIIQVARRRTRGEPSL